jgi:hypothetical protein
MIATCSGAAPDTWSASVASSLSTFDQRESVFVIVGSNVSQPRRPMARASEAPPP